jgi:hypothetical protein
VSRCDKHGIYPCALCHRGTVVTDSKRLTGREKTYAARLATRMGGKTLAGVRWERGSGRSLTA